MRLLTSPLPLLPRLIQALHLQKQRLVVNLYETEGGREGGREGGDKERWDKRRKGKRARRRKGGRIGRQD
jgi:hypothetical protein